ncbi:hypothetical protein EW146_g1809 [Bondarzewia mesenterica]|uniref:FAD-binding PCMH-type domain-containing protein n=1 Tax=Bondarzewia mesenterica TaxID=1095465 RepID=A0A4S4M8X2_9AGAM|nr:hypothetical protein EW146_g1809 [Bondarzewia mesenterica]
MVAKLVSVAGVLLSAVALGASMKYPRWGSADVQDTCEAIAAAISSASDVYYPLSIHFNSDIAHWASSSSQISTCSVEPGTAEDVGEILQILGSTRTPFAVKGGGHSSNPGFSSTTGVHIAMTRFNNVTYHADSQTADIGAGLVWDDVYSALEPYNVNVVGGRVTGVGVAGFTLGGGTCFSFDFAEILKIPNSCSIMILGYSWKTNQYGLTVDTVEAFEMVFPNGTISIVTPAYEDLFFGLKGGFNNFGIVTKFTLKTFPQTQVWGGLVTITQENLPQLNAAVANFSANVTDPKAAIISAYNFVLGAPGVSLLCFYDGPTYPDGIFDQLMAVPHFTKDISTRSFISLVQSAPSDATSGTRTLFSSVSILQYTPALLDVIVNETKFWGQNLLLDTATFVSYDVEPFAPSLFTHGSASAYPPDRSRGLLPLNIYFAWGASLADSAMYDAITQSSQTITAAAISDGQDIADAAIYGNYALFDTPLENIYGSNVDRLKSIKQVYDPDNVMGLTGGFKF